MPNHINIFKEAIAELKQTYVTKEMVAAGIPAPKGQQPWRLAIEAKIKEIEARSSTQSFNHSIIQN